MRFTPTKIEGVWIIDMERHEDERGWFARTWCAGELRQHGLDPCVEQCSSSFNKTCGTLRGMHFQAVPHEEAKVVRCIRGAVYDVALDLRVDSATYCQWVAAELSPENGRALYIPRGCAHGFQTLTDNTELLYMISTPYNPASSRCWRWNDPAFQIHWPLADHAFLSERDCNAPDYQPGKVISMSPSN